MVVTHTTLHKVEVESVGSYTTSAWTSVDLTGHGVANSSVVEILVYIQSDDTSMSMGVREYGSSLDRRFVLNHCGTIVGNQQRGYTTYVQADSSARIEYYIPSNYEGGFYVLGYLEGCTFTEALDSYACPATWTNQALSGGAGKAHHIVGYNASTSADSNVGVRENGSINGIYLDLCRSRESGAVNTAGMFLTTSDASNIIETTDNGDDASIYDMGYFSFSTVEVWGSLQRVLGWQTVDVTTLIPNDGDIVFSVSTHNDSVNYETVGFDDVGASSADRLWLHARTINGGEQGQGMMITTDASGQFEAYFSNNTQHFKCLCYIVSGWGHKINTVDSPAEVNSVAGEDIDKINTVQA